MTNNSEIVAAFTQIVGADGVRPDHSFRSIDPIDLAIYPNTQQELADSIELAAKHKLQIIPCGNGSKINWGGLIQSRAGCMAISTARLDRLIEHAVGDLTVTVEAGIRFADLQAMLAKANQFLAIDPAYPATSTLGGIVATASTGSLRQRYGGVRDLLLGISFVRSDGEQVKAGGRVVKNVAGYDLMKLLTGSFGTLGAISQLTFRLYPLPENSQTVVLTGAAEMVATAQTKLLSSTFTPAIADLISLGLDREKSEELGLAVRFDGIEASVTAQSDQLIALGKALNLKGENLTDSASFWQDLQDRCWQTNSDRTAICKLGILPSQASEVLGSIAQLHPQIQHYAQIHAASGLGILRLDRAEAHTIGQIRDRCAATGGFLSILEAPVEIKQNLDVWGYTGNSIEVMQRLKQQFDPDNMFSPGRFLVG